MRKQLLSFLDIGTEMSMNHNNAFYYIEREDNKKDLVLIDISMLNVDKVLYLLDTNTNIDRVYCIITHTHDDHISGLGVLSNILAYQRNKKLSIISDRNLVNDIYEYMRLINTLEYEIHSVEDSDLKDSIKSIHTYHCYELSDKTFGYHIDINGRDVVYTGDTMILEPFITVLEDLDNAQFYCECSYNKNAVHLYWKDQKDRLIWLAEKHEVYIMHMDDPSKFYHDRINDKLGKVRIASIYKDFLGEED